MHRVSQISHDKDTNLNPREKLENQAVTLFVSFVPSEMSGLGKKPVLMQTPLISKRVCVLTGNTDFNASLQLRGKKKIQSQTSFSVGLGQG